MKIGLDIDGVIADFVTGYSRSRNSTITPEDVKDWDMWKYYNLTKSEFYRDLADKATRGFFLDLPVIPGAGGGVHSLRDQGHYIAIISNRSVPIDTLQWLADHYIPYDRLYLSFFKGPIIRAEGLEYMIDDSPHIIETTRKAGAIPLIFDQPWNREEKAPRVKNWQHITDYFRGRK